MNAVMGRETSDARHGAASTSGDMSGGCSTPSMDGSTARALGRATEETRFGSSAINLKRSGAGPLDGPALERMIFSDLAELLLTDYRINRKRSLARIGCTQ